MARSFRPLAFGSFIAACGLAACGSDDAASGESTGMLTGPGSATTTTIGGPPGDDDGSGVTDETGGPIATTDDGDPTAADDSTGDVPAVPEVRWIGRYDTSRPMARRMGWSGAGFVVRFDGTGASVVLDDQAQYFTLVIDGTVQAPLQTSGGEQTYVLATGLPAGEHTIELYRRTEGSFGASEFGEVQLEGELLPPPPVLRRMEVVGDSITAGYGNEGTSPCSFSAETENHYMTYPAIAARAVGAELHTIAWSGKGVVNNYGDDTFEPMPEVYDRALASEGASWDFSWPADVVVINLGTNDFSTDGDPPENVFVPAYVELMAHVRNVHPGAYILAVAPSLFGDEATMVEGYLQSAVDERIAAGDPEVGFANINVEWIGSGCDGHPTVATHEGMGMRLQDELQARLGW